MSNKTTVVYASVSEWVKWIDKFLLKERVKNLGLFHWEGAEKSIDEIYSTEALKRA